MSNPVDTAGGGSKTVSVSDATGKEVETAPELEVGSTEKSETVSRDAYERLMNQHKNATLRLKQLEGKLSEKESAELKEYEQKLMKSGDVQKLIQIKDEKIESLTKQTMELQQGYTQLQSTLQSAAKTQAVLSRLPGSLLHNEYMAFIDTDKVVVNPETGDIDGDSVDVVVNEFVKKHSHLIKTDPRVLPNGTPKPAQKLSYAEWTKLPLKERRARMKDVEGFKPSIK